METPVSLGNLGTFTLTEDILKVDPRDGMSYEVPRGEYPVMGMLSDDGKQIQKAGIVFSTQSTNNEKQMDIIEMIRPRDIPAMVQRREISINLKADKTLAYPLSMFLGNESEQRHNKSQAQTVTNEQSIKMGRSM